MGAAACNTCSDVKRNGGCEAAAADQRGLAAGMQQASSSKNDGAEAAQKIERPVSPKSGAQPKSPKDGAMQSKTSGQKDFSLKNFMPTNGGKLEEFFDVQKEKIGEGGFGSVRKAMDKRTRMACAVKSIRKSDANQVNGLKQEIELMRGVDHPNIVRFIESFEDKRVIYIFLELCEGGELFDRICEAGRLTEQSAATCVKQMMLAINYLHGIKIMHRDLKPENWLLATKQDIGRAPLKLIDFGISTRFEPGTHRTTKTGTPNYVAPEVLTGKYDEKSDIWSIGVIAYVMVSGRQPFGGSSVEQILKAVKAGSADFSGSPWKNLSGDCVGLLKSLLQKIPAGRPSAKQTLAHGWFSATGQPTAASKMTQVEVGGLEAFGRMNRLKRAAITVIATQLSHAQIGSLRDMFTTMDANGDGTLTVAELKHGLEKTAIKLPSDLNQLLQEVDTDGSGVVNYTEFLAATMDKKLYNQEQVVWNAFKKFDLDGSGAIDRDELAQVLGSDEIVDVMHVKVEQKRLLELFSAIDVNNDGMIDFEEFFAMMRQVEDTFTPLPNRVMMDVKNGPCSTQNGCKQKQVKSVVQSIGLGSASAEQWRFEHRVSLDNEEVSLVGSKRVTTLTKF